MSPNDSLAKQALLEAAVQPGLYYIYGVIITLFSENKDDIFRILCHYYQITVNNYIKTGKLGGKFANPDHDNLITISCRSVCMGPN